MRDKRPVCAQGRRDRGDRRGELIPARRWRASWYSTEVVWTAHSAPWADIKEPRGVVVPLKCLHVDTTICSSELQLGPSQVELCILI